MNEKRKHISYSKTGEFLVAVRGGYGMGVTFLVTGRPLRTIPEIKIFGSNVVFNGDSTGNKVPLRMIVI